MIEFFIWLIPFYILLGFTEYWVHRNLMHKRRFKSKYLNWVWYDHAVLHHKQDDNTQNIDLLPHFHLIVGSPLIVFLAWFSLPAMFAFITICLYHSLLWTTAHRAIHGVGCQWMNRFKFYQKMKIHHEGHHFDTTKNYGVCMEFPDKLFGTKI